MTVPNAAHIYGLVDQDRLQLAADRLHRAAHIADRVGGDQLAGPLLSAAHLLRMTAAGRLSRDGEETSHALADAILGRLDGQPLPWRSSSSCAPGTTRSSSASAGGFGARA